MSVAKGSDRMAEIVKRPQKDVLREFINNERMTQSEFAKKVGIAEVTVSMWMKGKRGVSMRSIRKIESVFNKRIDL